MKENDNLMQHGVIRDDSIKNGVILRRKLPAKVYYVESDEDWSVMIGIGVVAEKVRTKQGDYVQVRWFDTLRDRIMTAVRFFEKEGAWGFERDPEEGGGKYYFRPMTLEIYNEKVKNRTKGKVEFDDEKKLIEGFLETEKFAD